MRPVTIKSLEFLKTKINRLSKKDSHIKELDWSNLSEEQASELIKLLHSLDEKIHSSKNKKKYSPQDLHNFKGKY